MTNRLPRMFSKEKVLNATGVELDAFGEELGIPRTVVKLHTGGEYRQADEHYLERILKELPQVD
jgi:hypothetical protein